MKIIFKEVKGGTVDSKLRYIDYWILGMLDNGKEIEIFDLEPFNLQKYENQTLDCLLFAWIQDITTENNDQYEFTGKFLGKYEIPSIWIKRNPLLEYGKNNYEAIEIATGILLTDSGEFNNDIENGQVVAFNVIRFDLRCWLK